MGEIMNITAEKLIELVKSYNPDEVEFVKKAYYFAKEKHDGQFRQSGEPYINHPIMVTYILANMHADRDTLCAAMLHDVIEDCNVTKKQISLEFNESIAELVDGVTNLTQINFKDKSERDFATKRKIILGITKDARIIIIKLADRLHNMLTLQYKSQYKRIEKAEETLEFYVPLARYIGAEKLRRELEDLSFQYLDKENYIKTKNEITQFVNSRRENLNTMFKEFYKLLFNENIPHNLKLRIKNVYSIFNRLNNGEDIQNIHDFIAIKVIVDDIKNCYNALRIVHSLYNPSNSTFKDYICNPKSNMYSSLHTSVYGPEDILVQTQIRTFEMEKINMYGLTAYWDICKGEAGNKMQEILKERFQFVKSVKTINRIFKNNEEFINHVKSDVLFETIFVYDNKGRMYEITDGATIIDFAYQLGSDVGNKMIKAYLNGHAAKIDTPLHNGDRVYIVTSDEVEPKIEWVNNATTVKAQRAIKKNIK